MARQQALSSEFIGISEVMQLIVGVKYDTNIRTTPNWRANLTT
jgi:hypothetical protein